VFLCGEWQFSRDIAYLFATFHRLFACCRMVPTMEMVTGVASLMAEYNGLEKYWHIRKKLSHMAQVTEAFKAMSLAACMFPEEDSALDLVHPNQMYINISKYMYADNFPELTKLAQDICGGIVADPICYSDWMNPDTQPLIDKYLGGKAGVPTEHRLRAIRLLHDITGGRHVSHNIHAEGSLAAQEMMFYAASDWDSYKKSAKRAAGIPGGEDEAAVARHAELRSRAADLMPPVDDSYNL
jgi:4-hydroxybutyryl-CoA dehydratase/vinylacetyl-CoA-Delta-isomerase